MPTPDQYVSSLDGQDAPALPTPAKPRRPRKRRWLKAVGWLLLLVLVAVVGYGFILANNVAKISTQPFDLAGLATDGGGRTNILVLGVGDPGHSGEKLSDSIMVISLDSQTKRVAQISLPRDLRVQIPGYGFSKINVANALGGTTLAQQTVSDTLGIPIHYYVETNFTGLRDLVDAVGGIEVDVKERLVDTEYPCDDNQYRSCGLDIQPGLQHMDGVMALKYARCRKGTCGNDFGRAERQQEVISLVREKATTWDTLLNPAKLTPVTTALRSGLKTNMSAVQMAQLAWMWQQSGQNQPVRLVLSTSPGGYLRGAGTSDLVPVGGSFDEIQSRVQNIFTEPTQPGDLPE